MASAGTSLGSVLGRVWRSAQTRDRELLREFLDQDRLFAAYAICDLDDREFGRTRWGVAFDDGRPVAVVMEYRGLSPQPLFVMGDPAGRRGVPARCHPATHRVPRRHGRSCRAAARRLPGRATARRWCG